MSARRSDLLPPPRPAAAGMHSVPLPRDVWLKLVRYARIKEGDPKFASIVAARLLDDALGERLDMAERIYAIRRNQEKLG